MQSKPGKGWRPRIELTQRERGPAAAVERRGTGVPKKKKTSSFTAGLVHSHSGVAGSVFNRRKGRDQTGRRKSIHREETPHAMDPSGKERDVPEKFSHINERMRPNRRVVNKPKKISLETVEQRAGGKEGATGRNAVSIHVSGTGCLNCQHSRTMTQEDGDLTNK